MTEAAPRLAMTDGEIASDPFGVLAMTGEVCVPLEFEVAGGTVAGREHVLAGRNNQDAFCWSATPEAVVAVVADGCSSGRHNEVGAQIGARLMAEALRNLAGRFGEEPPESLLERVRLDVLAQLRVLALAMGGSLSQVVADYLLFTLVGAVVTPHTAVTFALGDGVAVVNGAYRRWTYPDNAPPYLTYGLSGSSLTDADPGLLRFRVVDVRSADALSFLLVGTDGVGDLEGPLAPFWTDDRYFRNPYTVTRRLAQASRAPVRLPDDTTLVVLRRRA